MNCRLARVDACQTCINNCANGCLSARDSRCHLVGRFKIQARHLTHFPLRLRPLSDTGSTKVIKYRLISQLSYHISTTDVQFSCWRRRRKHMAQKDDYPRDMMGYGENPPHPHWPGDARIAIQIALNY